MKTLVTGASGFVGKHLAKRLVEEDKTVVCLVRRTSDTTFLEKLGVELVYGDLCDKNSLRKISEDAAVDIVYHLAGLVYSNRAKKFYEVNVRGTRNLLEILSPQGLKRFIYLSSIAVNGFSKNGKLIDENYPCNPYTPYGKSKLNAENLILDFYADTKIAATIVRVPVVYGPDGQADVLTKNFQKILKGKAFMVRNGKNLRSICFIDNLIEGLILAERGSREKGDLYVIADERAYSFVEIINTIADAYNVAVHIVHLPPFFASLSRYTLNACSLLGFYSWTLYSLATLDIDIGCDTKKAENELGYKAAIDLKTGIKETLDFYRN